MTLCSALIRRTLAAACCALSAAAMAQGSAMPATDAKTRLAIEAAFAKADINGDGKLTREEAEKVPEIAAKFEVLDKDKDGSLSLAEFAAGYQPG